MSASEIAAQRPPRLPALDMGSLLLPVPGLVVTGGIAALAVWLHSLPSLHLVSPLILAIVIGMAAHNALPLPAILKPGITFSLRRLLRLAIILLGLQLTFQQVGEVGGTGVAIIVATLCASLGFTTWLGRRLGVDAKLTQLIAAGTSICGASAVIATNTVTRGSDEDVAYAVAIVTVFGSLSMLIFPVLASPLGLDAHAFGLWAGASIHEIAQVVAASFQDGRAAGEFGTIAKLTRVMLLAPVVIGLGMLAAGNREKGAPADTRRIPIPWFVLGFITMIGVNSLDILPAAPKDWAVQATTFLLTVSLAAMGLETNIRKLLAKGVRPLLVGAGAWVFISVFSLTAIHWLY
jgi:uncharacterized integral membrane protein (TIGR00698 family)